MEQLLESRFIQSASVDLVLGTLGIYSFMAEANLCFEIRNFGRYSKAGIMIAISSRFMKDSGIIINLSYK